MSCFFIFAALSVDILKTFIEKRAVIWWIRFFVFGGQDDIV